MIWVHKDNTVLKIIISSLEQKKKKKKKRMVTFFFQVGIAVSVAASVAWAVPAPLRAVVSAARRYHAEERNNAMFLCSTTLNPLVETTRAAGLDLETDPTLNNRQWGCHYELLWSRLLATARAVVESKVVGVTGACNILTSVDAGRHSSDRSLKDMLNASEFDLGVAVLNATRGYARSSSIIRVPMRGKSAHIDNNLVTAVREVFVIDLLTRELERTRQADGTDVDAVVEFGAGWGRNLLNLRTHFPFLEASFHAAEYTAAGARASEILFRHYNPATPFSSFRFDYLFPDASPLLAHHGGRAPQKTLAFTIHSVEQVHRANCSLIAEMRSTGVKVVGVHLEPVGFQIAESLGQKLDEFDHILKQTSLIENQGFNANLMECVDEAVKRGEIRIVSLEKNIFDASSAIVWEKLR
jgi:hypothetical protein